MLSIARLSYDDAQVLLEGAAQMSRQIAVPMCIAITDEAGHLIAFQRMDGSKVLSVTLCQEKAMTSAVSRKPTHKYNEDCHPGHLSFGIQNAMDGKFSTVGGGYPVMVDGVVVGAIGCSSGTPEQDMQCAAAGLAAFLGEEG